MKRFLLALLFIILMFIMNGCWSLREVDRMALITSSGIDKLPNGNWYWTVELPLPLEVTPSAVSGGGGTGGMNFIIRHGEGKTIAGAEEQLIDQTSREILWYHNSFLIIGEEVMRKHMNTLLDFLTRRFEIRRNILLFAAEGQASSIISEAQPILDTNLREIFLSLTASTRAGKYPIINANDLLRTLATEGKDPYLPIIRLKKHEMGSTFYLQGIAAFRGSELIDFFGEDIQLGVFFMTGKGRYQYLYVPCSPEHPELTASARVLYSHSRVSMTGDSPSSLLGRVNTQGQVIILDWLCDDMSPETIRQFEQTLNERIVELIERALKEMKEKKTDLAGFGAALHRTNPKLWHEVRHRWHEIFMDLPVEIHSNLTVQQTGLTFGAR